MKSMRRFVIITTIAACILPIFASPTQVIFAKSARQTSLQDQNRTISVSGEAQVNVVPDQVVITLGVETNDKDLKIAKSQNDERISSILATVKSFGVAPEKVQTDYIGVEPRYDTNYTKREFLGFFVRKNVVVTLSDLSKFEDLLSALLDSGANYLMGIQFRTTDLRKYRDQARSLAIKAAKEKAEALAGELGQKIGKPLTISEEPLNYWSYYNSWWGGYYGSGSQNMTQNAVQNAAPANSSSAPSDGETVAPGQIAITARVAVTFELTD